MLTKKFKKRFAALLATVTLIISSMAVYAAENDIINDHAGNLFVAGQSLNVDKNVEGDLFANGYDLTVVNATVDGSAIIAGYNVNLDSVTTGGTAYMAGYSLDADITTDHNIFAAAYSINLDSKSSAGALFYCGAMATVGGTYKDVHVAAANVYFDAVVEGDATISAENVTFGPNASVGGKLSVTSEVEPDHSSVSCAEFSFTPSVSTENAKEVKESAAKIAFLAVTKRLRKFLFWALAYMIIGLLMYLLMPMTLKGSAEMVKNRTAAMLLTGGITCLAAPLALILVCITFIGAPLALIVAVALLLLKLIAIPFAYASIGRKLIFGKTKLGDVAAITLCMLIAAFVKVLPFVGGLVSFACTVYTFGYFLQKLYLEKANSKAAKVSADTEATE